MKKTINELMVTKKVMVERIQDLKQLRQSTAVDKSSVSEYGDGRRVEQKNEAKYDTKALDRRITEMQNAMLLIDSAIKQSNAITTLDLPIDVDHLLSPME